MKKILLVLVIFFGILSVTATGGVEDFFGSYNCDEEINDQLGTRGTTSDVTRYDAEGYHSHDYCWHKSYDDFGGICYTFTWGDDFDCEISTFSY